MKKFIFTFGCGQVLQGHCQPIYAENMRIARAKMFEIHGRKWGFPYTEEEWEKARVQSIKYGYKLETELNPIYCVEEEII